MMKEQDAVLVEWKKQLYYEHNRDTSLKRVNRSNSRSFHSKKRFEYSRHGYIRIDYFEY